MAFVRREFLNDEDSPFTGTAVAYDGPDPWDMDDTDTFLEVGDCHNKVRLHESTLEGRGHYIQKLKTLRAVVDDFIRHLERTGK
jgi:hypothetical protein